MKPVIAIDIDEVLFGFTQRFLAYHNRQYQTNFALHQLTTTAFHTVMGGTADDDKRKVGEFQLEAGNLDGEPVPRAIEVLKRLKTANELVIITARHANIEQQTRTWLERTFPDTFTDIHFANYWDENRPRRSKGVLCRDLGVQIIIDDQPSYIIDCLEYGVKGILFGDYPWNREVINHPDVRRVMDWCEVEAAVTEHKPYTNYQV
jgi:uncharacterized HAD superfamily protein